MTVKFLRLLGLSRRASKVVLGAEKAYESLKQKKAHAVFIASDLSAKTEKELKFKADGTDIKVIRTEYDIETLSKAVGSPTGVIAVEDEGFANALLGELEGGK